MNFREQTIIVVETVKIQTKITDKKRGTIPSAKGLRNVQIIKINLRSVIIIIQRLTDIKKGISYKSERIQNIDDTQSYQLNSEKSFELIPKKSHRK